MIIDLRSSVSDESTLIVTDSRLRIPSVGFTGYFVLCLNHVVVIAQFAINCI